VTELIANLMEANLLGVFNERDAQRRTAAIASTYAADVRWTDDEGVSVGREALEAKAKALQSKMQGLVFAKASPVYQTRGLGYSAWTVGPDGGDPVASGFDVAIVRDGLISELYTQSSPPRRHAQWASSRAAKTSSGTNNHHTKALERYPRCPVS
jgi:hypothetical protein